MPLPVSLKSCRSRPSPAIRSSLCRSTPRPRRTGRDFAHSEFLRDRLKKNSKQCSSIAKLKLVVCSLSRAELILILAVRETNAILCLDQKNQKKKARRAAREFASL